MLATNRRATGKGRLASAPPFVRALWDVWLDFVVYVANHVVGHIPSHRARLWFYRNLMGWKIGSQTSLHERLRLMGVPGGDVRIGDNVCIGHDFYLAGAGYPESGFSVGNNVNIAMHVFVILGGHDIATDGDFGTRCQHVSIGDHAVIFARSTICMANIGEGAVVLPGSVVVKDVEPYTVVGGAPAKFVKKREPQRPPEFRLNWRWRFH